jgi:hypothetical protein
MAVDSTEHGEINVSKQGCDIHRINSRFSHSIVEGMSEIVQADLPADVFLEPFEAAVHREHSPRVSFGVPEQGPFGILEHPPAGDLQGPVGEIDEADSFSAPMFFAFVGLEDPTVLVDISFLDTQGFLGPRPAVPRHNKELTEVLIGHMGEQLFELVRSDDILPCVRGGLFQVWYWVGFDVSVLGSPCESPLDCTTSVVLAGRIPVLSVDPVLDVVWLEMGSGKGTEVVVGQVVTERFEVLAIPAVGLLSPVFLSPVKEFIHDDQSGISFGRLRRLGEKFVELPGGFLLVRAKSMSDSVDLDAPLLPSSPIPELVWAWHGCTRLALWT